MTMKIRLLILLLIILKMVESQFIKETDSYRYQEIIKSIYEYYHCHSLTLLYASPKWEKLGEMKNLLMIFSTNFLIKTSVGDMNVFASTFSKVNFYQSNKPMFVLFNDANDITAKLFQVLDPFIDISRAVWIIFSTNDTSIDVIFKNIYIPFNCKFMIIKSNDNNINNNNNDEIITEIYRVNKNSELRESFFGTWNRVTGMQFLELPFIRRRNNLYGINLRAAILKGPGVSVTRNKDHKITEIGSYCGQILNSFRDQLNFTLSYKEVSVIGSCSSNGSCTGGVDTIARHITDIFPFDLRISSARMDVMDYTIPLYITNQRLYIQKPPPKLLWDRYLKPFDTKVWDTIAWLLPIYSGIITFIKQLQKNNIIDNSLSDDTYQRLADIFFISYTTLCGISTQEPTEVALRVTQFTMYTTLTILSAAYSAILITSLAFKTFEPPFTTMEGLMKDGSYKLGILKDSADYDFFQNSSVKIMADLFALVMAHEATLPTTRIEGLRRICCNNKYAYFSPDVTTEYFPMKNCTLVPLDVVVRAPFSMALQHNSPYLDIINYRINTLRESGVLWKIFDENKIYRNKIEDTWISVELPDILPLIVLLIVSGILSMLVLICELIHKKLEIKRKEKLIITSMAKHSNYLPYCN